MSGELNHDDLTPGLHITILSGPFLEENPAQMSIGSPKPLLLMLEGRKSGYEQSDQTVI